ncbi:MAG: acyl-homoserine-lactone synthase [Rhizomicrobium sp.]
MIEVVTSGNALLYQDALEDMFRLRHRMLVETRGFLRLRSLDGLQKDRFDTEDAIYLLLTEDDGTVSGALRLLPTTGPHVFSEILPASCAVRGVQRGPDILEVSRLVVDEERLGRPALELARKHIVVGLLEFCVRAGYRKVTLLMPPDVLFRHLLIGLDIKPLGLATEYNGGSQLAVIATVTQEVLDTLRLALNVMEPLVHHVGAPAGDPLSLASAQIPRFPLAAAE